MGYPIAFATQDGLEVDEAPWDELNVLFVGGSDFHKLGPSAWALIRRAQELGKWVHIGRVNSALRLGMFWTADSWDGTTLSIEPSLDNQARIVNTVKQIRMMKKGRRLI
jgi:hypothetical protein